MTGKYLIRDIPFVSIIMPIRNEEAFIARSLGTVLSQEYPSNQMEILIADGMSTDNTRKIIHSLQKHHTNLLLIDNPGKIVSTGFNAALLQAKGEIVIRVDGHCEIAPDYVQRCVEVMKSTGADSVGGTIVTVGKTKIAQTIALAQSSIFGVGGASFRTGTQKPGYAEAAAFPAFHKQLFKDIGGFDEELVRNQDDEFNFRLTQNGGKIWIDPSIRSVYYSRASLYGLWKQYFQYGFYKVRVIQKRKALHAWRHLVPATFVLSLLGSCFLALLTGQWLWLLTIAGPYIVVSIMISMWLIISKLYKKTFLQKGLMLPLLPPTFLILHLSYGLGFLWGLWIFTIWDSKN